MGTRATSRPGGLPAGRPGLQERLAAYSASGRYPVAPPETPVHTGPEPDEDEALATLRSLLPVTWVREFVHVPGDDGARWYLDPRTRRVHKALPDLHSTDGNPI